MSPYRNIVTFFEPRPRRAAAVKRAIYAGLYGREQELQTLIDEEGCGAFFAAVIYGDEK